MRRIAMHTTIAIAVLGIGFGLGMNLHAFWRFAHGLEIHVPAELPLFSIVAGAVAGLIASWLHDTQAQAD